MQKRLLENSQRVEFFNLLCWHQTCHHSPDAYVCVRDNVIPNFDTGAGMYPGGAPRPLIEATDYERCFDCGALIWWAPTSNKETYYEMLIEPHTVSCWHTRNDPGGYNAVQKELFA